MEIDIHDEYLIDIYQGKKPEGKPKYQPDIIKKFIKTVNILKSIPRIEAMFQLNSLNYEKLSGDKVGYSSVRVTKQFRIEFIEVSDNEGCTNKLIITNLSNHYK